MQSSRTSWTLETQAVVVIGTMLLMLSVPLQAGEQIASALGDCKFPPGGDDYPIDMKRQGLTGRVLVSVERNTKGRLVNFSPTRVEVNPAAIHAARTMLSGVRCPTTAEPRRLSISIVYAMESQPAPIAFPESDVKILLTGSFSRR